MDTEYNFLWILRPDPFNNTINQRFGYYLNETKVVDKSFYETMYRIQEMKSDKRWKLFLAGTTNRIAIRENLIDDIILYVVAKGQSRKEAYEKTALQCKKHQTLQNMQNTIKFTPYTVHKGKWIVKCMRTKKPNNQNSNDMENQIFILVSQTPIQPIEQPPPRKNKEKGKPR